MAAALARSGFDPAFLELEIAESLFLRDDDPTRAQREKLLAQGVRFCVDDFGTGYSSLAYLARLDVHALKIDRLFVRDLIAGSSTEAIVRAIVAIAQALRLRVMAEGVETELQRDLLAPWAPRTCRATCSRARCRPPKPPPSSAAAAPGRCRRSR